MSFVYVFEEDFFANYSNDSSPLYTDPNTSTCEYVLLEPTAAVTLCLILIVIFLLAVPGNLLVGWVISTSKQALTPSDVYLFHLTIADGLMALTLPFFAVATTRGWLFGDFLCKLLNLIKLTNFYTSIIFLACISIDRYLVIVHARETLKSRQRMCSRSLCAAMWALGCALALPALFNKVTKLADGRIICAENFDIGTAAVWRLASRGFILVFGFLIPATVMIACYSVTVARLLLTRGFQKHRAMRVIITVVIAFLLCWTPYQITMVIEILLRSKVIRTDCFLRTSVSTALIATEHLALLHSCINPFLYAFVGEKFRKKMKLVLQRKFRQERMSGSKFSRSTSQTSEGTGTVL
ncbi:C-X-C chemokine receptor type 2-like [Archocentrus centrarchus]|uniref:C-X-C chemokine receptor type 2-like n=1 Tax=Archocentrus centrarchus TaxID=63155 RepID=UPI0011EA2EEE|nr:C-X-C chemokine receptor type 2-like [Archocentrus centrarchus]